MSLLLQAQPVIDKKLPELSKQVSTLKDQGATPHLRVILVGDNPASLVYIGYKQKMCEKVGAHFELLHLREDISEPEFLEAVKDSSEADYINGVIIQLPLPKHLSHIDVSQLVSPEKDVDGFHPQNLYHAITGNKSGAGLLPCTPKGVINLLNHYSISLTGLNCVVIGRSMIVGRPLSYLLTSQNATVTLCHSKTKDLKSFTKKADLIVAAIGSPKFIDPSFIGNNHPVIVDVGIHKEDEKLCGDVDFPNVQDKVKAITPVPGGVGPLTVLSLIENLIIATQYQLRS